MGISAGARRLWLYGVAGALVCGGAGFVIGERSGDEQSVGSAFHDIRVIRPDDLQSLVDPKAAGVGALARQLGTLEAAYLFVRDRIAFEPSMPASAPAQTLRDGRASCLGKATLLVSLYRALGVPAESVRVVTGQVPFAGSLLEHAWVDLEYGSLCLQQDPTDLLGTHDFQSFPGQTYVQGYVHRELFCFNDGSFAVVSQLNRLRGRHP